MYLRLERCTLWNSVIFQTSSSLHITGDYFITAARDIINAAMVCKFIVPVMWYGMTVATTVTSIQVVGTSLVCAQGCAGLVAHGARTPERQELVFLHVTKSLEVAALIVGQACGWTVRKTSQHSLY